MRLFPRSPKRSTSTESDLQKANERQEYCDRELIPTEKNDRSVSKVQSMLALIENLWQNAIASLTEEPELDVWQKKDRYDHINWYDYDPWTSECFFRDRFFRDQYHDLNH